MVHTNIFKPGSNLYLPASLNFNEYFGVQPGDQVLIPAGKYGNFEFFQGEGIEFINDGGVAEFDFISIYKGTKDITLNGGGSGSFHGIKMSHPGYFGGRYETVGNLTFKKIHVKGSAMGLQMNHYPGEYLTDKVNLLIEDCLIEDVAQEGLYLGHDTLGGPFTTGVVKNTVVRNCGRDGIQCRNGRFHVENNVIENVGLNGEDYHSHGLLFGGNSSGGVAKNNKISGVAGLGMFINGYGEFVIDGNQVQSRGSAIFSNNYALEQDYQKLNFQRLILNGNTLTPGNGKAIEVLHDPAKAPVMVQWGSNNYTGELRYEAGVQFNTVDTVKLLWTAYKVIAGKRKYYNVYSDYTWSWK